MPRAVSPTIADLSVSNVNINHPLVTDDLEHNQNRPLAMGDLCVCEMIVNRSLLINDDLVFSPAVIASRRRSNPYV
jgi:hypothetical protein